MAAYLWAFWLVNERSASVVMLFENIALCAKFIKHHCMESAVSNNRMLFLNLSLLVKQQMTNTNVEKSKKKKHQKSNYTLKLYASLKSYCLVTCSFAV